METGRKTWRNRKGRTGGRGKRDDDGGLDGEEEGVGDKEEGERRRGGSRLRREERKG